jgi:HD-like signal output (HDOD) protein
MQAVNLLGLETIKALALVVHIFTEYGDQLRGEVQVSDIWRHILRVGSCARDLTRVETGSEKQAEESFVAGLLHDVGKLVLAANMPAAYHTMLELCRTEHLSLLDAEMRVFHAHHATAGGFLLGVWGLPDSLIEAIIFHHRPLEALKMVHVADVMVELNDQHPELQTEEIAQEQLETMIPVDCLSYLQAIGELGHLEQWWQLCRITLQAEQEREAEDERKNPVRR